MRNVRVYVKDIREGDWIKFPRRKEFGTVFRKREMNKDIYELIIVTGPEELIAKFSGARMLTMRIE